MDKVVESAADAVADIGDGVTLATGGFGVCGIPSVLLKALQLRGSRDITLISNNCGIACVGNSLLLENRQLSRLIASYVGENKELERQYLYGEVDIELTPQGTLAERLRAGGSGIAGFYTLTGSGTQVADGGLPIRHSATGAVLWPRSRSRRGRSLSTGSSATGCWRPACARTSPSSARGVGTGTAT